MDEIIKEDFFTKKKEEEMECNIRATEKELSRNRYIRSLKSQHSKCQSDISFKSRLLKQSKKNEAVIHCK